MLGRRRIDRANGRPLFALAVGAAAAFVFAMGSPAAAQLSPEMATPLYGGTSPNFHHVHEGPLGDAWLAVEESIRCSCGCNEDVHHCQFRMECGTSPGWSERILVALQKGQTQKQIQDAFVADFGLTVLMEPPMEGFNLVGWFLPGVAILMAGALVGLIVRGGMGRSEVAPVTELGAEDAERLREAMRKLDEAESPDW